MTQYIYGLHAARAALDQVQDIIKAYVLNSREDKKLKEILESLQAVQIPIQFLSREQLNALVPDANHQGIILQVKKIHVKTEHDIPDLLIQAQESELILILDGVQDPHNLGACLRTADAFGVNFVIAPKDKATGLTPVVRKVACGAAETIPFIQVTNLARTIRYLKEQGIWVYGLAGEGTATLYKTQFPRRCALVLGAEGKGLRQLTRDCCDELLSIPMHGAVSSLNVSVATGVALSEVSRQRVIKNGIV